MAHLRSRAPRGARPRGARRRRPAAPRSARSDGPCRATIPSWDEVAQLDHDGRRSRTRRSSRRSPSWCGWRGRTSPAASCVEASRRRARRRRATRRRPRPAQHLAANLLATISVAIALLTRPTAPASAAPTDLRLAVARRRAAEPAPQPGRPRRDYELDAGDGELDHGLEGHRDGEAHRADAAASRVRGPARRHALGPRRPAPRRRHALARDPRPQRRPPAARRRDDQRGHRGPPARAGRSLVPGVLRRTATAVCGRDRAESVVVERGDTLWDLADEHLDDPYRWPEIYEENRGDPQPGGGALTDPDLIQPGWELDLPGGEATGGAPPKKPPRSRRDRQSTTRTSLRSSRKATSADAGRHRARVAERGPAGPAGRRPVEQSAEPVVPTPTTSAVEPVEDQQNRQPPSRPTTSRSCPSPPPARLPPASSSPSIASVGHASAAGSPTTASRFRPARRRRRSTRLRAHADPDADRLLNLALRELSAHYADHRPGPPVVLVSHGPADVAVHLDAPPTPRPTDGTATTATTRGAVTARRTSTPWRSTSARHLASPLSSRSGLCPAAASACSTSAHAGCLHLDGDEDTARRLMAAWALELATTPRADALDVVAVGLDGLPDGLERLTTLSRRRRAARGPRPATLERQDEPAANGHPRGRPAVRGQRPPAHDERTPRRSRRRRQRPPAAQRQLVRPHRGERSGATRPRGHRVRPARPRRRGRTADREAHRAGAPRPGAARPATRRRARDDPPRRGADQSRPTRSRTPATPRTSPRPRSACSVPSRSSEPSSPSARTRRSS